MHDLSSQASDAIQEISRTGEDFESVFFIACAGENDAMNNTDVGTILRHFEDAVNVIFSCSDKHDDACQLGHVSSYLIFIGPKVEPWMATDDNESRIKYFQLSERLRIACHKLSGKVTKEESNCTSCPSSADGKSIAFLDCLTMFCEDNGTDGETLSVVNGSAIAQKDFFHSDELHLSDEGYGLWKDLVESTLIGWICNEKCTLSLDRSHRPIVL